MNHLNDINFNTEYLKAYEPVENGQLDTFRFSCDLGEGFVHYIKRSMADFPGYEKYYDIITPYGYGGQVICECEAGREDEVAARFNDAFINHCKQNNIVSYFARFNPLLGNADVFSRFFDALVPIRKVVVMDLTKDIVQDELTKNCRRAYKGAVSRGVEVEVCRSKEAIDDFISMYYSFMNTKNAQDYYYFPKSYFEYLFTTFPENAMLYSANIEDEISGEKTAIMYMMCIEYGDVVYLHLSGKKEGFQYYRPNHPLYVEAATHAKNSGCKYAMLGGGLSASEEDSLYQFKKKFSKSEPRTFYIGKKIFDEPVYNALCSYVDDTYGAAETDFFPQYRRPRQ